jgi:hypothetical protein
MARPRTCARLPAAKKDTTTAEGRVLRLHIMSTWGDPHYVGLTGLQVGGSAGIEALLQALNTA